MFKKRLHILFNFFGEHYYFNFKKIILLKLLNQLFIGGMNIYFFLNSSLI